MQSQKQFDTPSKTGYTVYTKSNCPYCIKAKELLKLENPEPNFINCDEYLVDPKIKEDFLTFIQSINGGIQHRTFPMIFYQEKFIGGFTDTEKFFSKEKLFSENSDF